MTLKFKEGDRVILNGKMTLLLENHTAPKATFENDIIRVTWVHQSSVDCFPAIFYSIASDELKELTKEDNIMVYANQLESIATLV